MSSFLSHPPGFGLHYHDEHERTERMSVRFDERMRLERAQHIDIFVYQDDLRHKAALRFACRKILPRLPAITLSAQRRPRRSRPSSALNAVPPISPVPMAAIFIALPIYVNP